MSMAITHTAIIRVIYSYYHVKKIGICLTIWQSSKQSTVLHSINISIPILKRKVLARLHSPAISLPLPLNVKAQDKYFSRFFSLRSMLGTSWGRKGKWIGAEKTSYANECWNAFLLPRNMGLKWLQITNELTQKTNGTSGYCQVGNTGINISVEEATAKTLYTFKALKCWDHSHFLHSAWPMLSASSSSIVLISNRSASSQASARVIAPAWNSSSIIQGWH